MVSFDRRAADRRGTTTVTGISLGAVLADERRARPDRRGAPRRRADLHKIEHYARRIGAPDTPGELVGDPAFGLQLMASFPCGCIAIEAIGQGRSALRTTACAAHAEPPVPFDRRRRR